ncbi:MAG TPA: class I SAM-dependent methyltransferase [Solirubrobacterales bacterium]|nr:class I SAM-dependent methyltransferase [Solirubrobacterales bacterium]
MGRIYDATWGRAFSALYDRLTKKTEEAGLREMRRETLAAASGRTIDIGGGTGANLGLYPDAVTELVLAEPDPHMVKRLRPRVSEAGIDAEVVEAPAERLPFEDASFDTAIYTLVLCTVPDQAAALAETARILKPGGKLLFVEHVRADDPGVARWQDRLHGPWKFFADGCHCNRDTLTGIEAAGFTVESATDDEMPQAPPLIRPLIRGSAVAGAAAAQ